MEVRGSALASKLTRELTPAQHRHFRTQLVLIPVYVWAAYAWFNFMTQFPAGAVPVRDFMHFYVQGVIARFGDAGALYDMDSQTALLGSLVAAARGVRYPPVYGPQVAVLFSPLAHLSYADALGVWQAFTVLAYVACGWALWLASAALRTERWSAFVLLGAAPALRFDLGSGQTAVLGMICVTLGFFAFRAERPFLAGLAIGALAYKPQLGLAVAFVCIVAREYRVVWGAVASAAVQIACGCLFWGGEILGPYLRALQRLPAVVSDMEPLKHQMHSWRPFFELMNLPSDVALALYLLAATVTLVTALVCWRSGGPLGARYSAVLLATVLVDPHLYAYDLLIVVPALLLLWDWASVEPDRSLDELWPVLTDTPVGRWSFRTSFRALLYVAYFSPVLGELAATIHVQSSVLIHGLILGIVAQRCLSERTARSHVAVEELPTRARSRAV